MNSLIQSFMASKADQVYQTSSTSTEESRSTSETDNTISNGDLGKEEFLQLLVSQLKNQNPMEPMDNKDFMAQMAQFNSLQQMQSLNSTMEKFIGFQQLTQASSLVGKEVKVLDSSTGDPVTGVIEKVDVTDSSPKVIIDGEEYDMGSIQEVLSGE